MTKPLFALFLLAIGLLLCGCSGNTPGSQAQRVPGPPVGAQPAVAKAPAPR